MKTTLQLTLVIGFALVCGATHGQQVNPNKLPPCPMADYSKNTDMERLAMWTNCWGRYQVELHKDFKGDVIEGEWKNGNLNGQGTYTHTKGDRYQGEWKDGKKHGQGTYYFLADNKFKGYRYQGEWKDDNRHGQGIFTWANGTRYEGIWENDQFIREAKVNLPSLISLESVKTLSNTDSTQSSAISSGLNLKDAGNKCEELGFKTGTERYGKCVLELSR